MVIINDGSNSNCQCTISSIASKTDNKTGKNVDAVSYMIAVSTANGMAVTFFMYRGGTVDNYNGPCVKTKKQDIYREQLLT